jgi:hypothetical protein
MRPLLLSHFEALSQYVALSSGREREEEIAAPAERQGSAYSAARFLKKAIRPWEVSRSVPGGTEASVQDWRTWKVHVEGSEEGLGTSWTFFVLVSKGKGGGREKDVLTG